MTSKNATLTASPGFLNRERGSNSYLWPPQSASDNSVSGVISINTISVIGMIIPRKILSIEQPSPSQISPPHMGRQGSHPPYRFPAGSRVRILAPLSLSYWRGLIGENATLEVCWAHDRGWLGLGTQNQELCHQAQKINVKHNYPVTIIWVNGD